MFCSVEIKFKIKVLPGMKEYSQKWVHKLMNIKPDKSNYKKQKLTKNNLDLLDKFLKKRVAKDMFLALLCLELILEVGIIKL